MRTVAALAFAIATLTASAATPGAIPLRVSVTTGGAPPPGEAYVALFRSGQPYTRPSAEGLTQDGVFIGELRPGSYEMWVDAPGHDAAIRRVRIPSPEAKALAVELRRGTMSSGRVLDANGVPVAGAQVRQLPAPFTELGRKHLGAARSTHTGEDGAWSLALAASSPRVLIERAGYAPYVETVNASAPRAVTLKAGGRLQLRLDRNDPSVLLTLVPLDQAAAVVPEPWQQEVWTRDAAGVVTWDSLATGEYRVVARARDPRRFVDKSDVARVVVVASGQQTVDVNVPVLRPEAPVTEWFVRGQQQNRVTELRPFTAGAGGATVVPHNVERVVDGTLFYIDAPVGTNLYLLSDDMIGNEAAQPESGDGELRVVELRGRADAKLRLVAPADQPLPTTGKMTCRYLNDGDLSVPVIVGPDGRLQFPSSSVCPYMLLRLDPYAPLVIKRVLAPGKVTDLGEFALRPAGSLELRVVADPAQTAVANAAIRVLFTAAGRDQVVAETVAAADGRAVLTGLPAGVPLTVEAKIAGTDRTGVETITTTAGERSTLDPFVIPAPASLVITHRFSDAFRAAFPQAKMNNISLRYNGAAQAQRSERTADGATVTFNDLRPGSWQVMGIVELPGNAAPIELADFELKAGDARKETLIVEPLVFRGRVTSAGQMVEAQMSVFTEIGGRSVRSKPSGEFVVVLPEPGRFAVGVHPIAVRPAGAPAGDELAARNMSNDAINAARARAVDAGVVDFLDPSLPVEIRLPQGAIDITVTSEGTPAAGVRVMAAHQSDGKTPRSRFNIGALTTDSRGTVRLQNLLDGTWLIEARGADERIARKAVVVGAGGATDVTLDLREQIKFEGTLRNRAGIPAVGARIHCVYLTSDELPQSVQATADESGKFSIKLASSPSTTMRCATMSGSALNPANTHLSARADLIVDSEKTGRLTISNWRQTMAWRDTLWLTNAEGHVFNLSALGSGGRLPEPMTIGALPAGSWKIVRAVSLAERRTVARGSTISLSDVASFRVTDGETTTIAIDEGKMKE